MSIEHHRIHATDCPCGTCRRRYDPVPTRHPVYYVIAVTVIVALLGLALAWLLDR